MIESLHFKNFKVLRNAKLSLRPFNVIVGPNGSGKSTVFLALEALKQPQPQNAKLLRTVGAKEPMIIAAVWRNSEGIIELLDIYRPTGFQRQIKLNDADVTNQHKYGVFVQNELSSIQTFSFEPAKIAAMVHLQPNSVLAKNGANLAAALDNLRDNSEAAYDGLRKELRQWLPEYDSIVFETPATGQRSFGLKQSFSNQTIKSTDLSEGTLTALALLYLAHNPASPSLICLEEPDRGIHPRLLRDLRDSLYRLSYPDQFGNSRNPIQVIVTTHSPYFLDLFKNHPEEIIIAEKQPDATALFKSLAEDDQLMELIGDSPLGEVWYSGILGGVPVGK